MTEVEFKQRVALANDIYKIVLDANCKVSISDVSILLEFDEVEEDVQSVDDSVDLPALASEFHKSL